MNSHRTSLFNYLHFLTLGEGIGIKIMFSDVNHFFRAKLYKKFASSLEDIPCLLVFARILDSKDALNLMKMIHKLQVLKKELELTVPAATNATVFQSTTINYNVLLRKINSGRESRKLNTW